MKKHKKYYKFIPIFLGLIIILLIAGLMMWDFSPKKISWGVTFSQEYAEKELGLNWRQTYLAILDDLKVSHLRLSAYWNIIEPAAGQYDFTDLDWQINEAAKRNVKIVLALGRRLPRWPECHDPDWLKALTSKEIETRQLAYMQKVVEHYQNNQQIIYWQVENEPFLEYFGQCPALDTAFLKEEIILVKNLTAKPVLVTDSGELSTWLPISKVGGDILGTTVYRVVNNKYLGYVRWFLPPAYYYLKAALIRTFTPIKKIIVAELQTEAWHKADTNLKIMTVEESFESMDLKQFNQNISFAKRAGFDEVYLWGAEWWYLLKTEKNFPAYWQEAKKLWP